MRCLFIAVVIMLLAAPAGSGQEAKRESALGTSLRDYGGFVGLDTRFGDMKNEFAVFTGGHAALLLKQRVYIGVGGAALTNDFSIDATGQDTEAHGMAYGGFLIGYVVPMPGLVQLTADVLIGAGGVRLGAPRAN